MTTETAISRRRRSTASTIEPPSSDPASSGPSAASETRPTSSDEPVSRTPGKGRPPRSSGCRGRRRPGRPTSARRSRERRSGPMSMSSCREHGAIMQVQADLNARAPGGGLPRRKGSEGPRWRARGDDARRPEEGEPDLVPIDEVARRLGLRASAIRYYEERGLLRPSARQACRCWYSPADIRLLAIIGHWQRARADEPGGDRRDPGRAGPPSGAGRRSSTSASRPCAFRRNR